MTTARLSSSFSRISSLYLATLRRYRNAAIFYLLMGFFFLPAQ